MKFKKKVLSNLACCYATCQVEVDGRPYYIFAPDDKGPCYSFDAETGEQQLVSEGPGGTMSIVPIPDRNGDFLISQNFLPVFAGKEAKIVQAIRKIDEWHVEPWVDMPYVHRFDILQRNGSYYFLGCILSSTEAQAVEWDAPGYLLAAELDQSFTAPKKFERIADGMHHNHGYWKFNRDGYDCALTACDEGVFEVIPPENPDQAWQVSRILNKAASDAVYIDIDGDGENELAVIEAFHGTDLVIYRKNDSEFVEMYRHPVKMNFLHAIWGGDLGGEPVLILGYRQLAKDLFLLRWIDGKIQSEIIEHGGGPSNLTVVQYKGNSRLLVANRESDQAVVFDVNAGE